MSGYTTRIELIIECRSLKNMDGLLSGKSDAMVVLYEGAPRNTLPGSSRFQRWVELGRTEVVRDNLNPTFTKTLAMDYRFEEQQPLRFVVVDVDNHSSTQPTARDDIIGEVQIPLGEIAGSSGQRMTLEIKRSGGKITGQMIVQMQPVNENLRDLVHMELQGVKLAKKDLFSSDPYLIIKRQSPTNPNDWIVAYRSETIMKSLNPKWKPVTLPLAKLTPTGNLSTRLLLEVWDYDKITEHDLIGTAQCTVQDLINRVSYTLESAKGKPAGTLVVKRCDVERMFGFLDYISRGCEVSLVVAIDWTGSNGDPRDPRSLHAVNSNTLNQYESAIRGVGSILAYYDRDQLFPAFGFGGKLPNGQVSHCFALNGVTNNPQCRGVDGIMAAYHQALRNVQLYGPTYFSEVIRATIGLAEYDAANSPAQRYYVLLIITDGVINDMQNTISAIVSASNLPISIVIVGVGNDDFSPMNVLDGDGKLLRSSNGATASRDIVQFVPFRKFSNAPEQDLSREVLAEIPAQLEQYFRGRNIRPYGL